MSREKTRSETKKLTIAPYSKENVIVVIMPDSTPRFALSASLCEHLGERVKVGYNTETGSIVLKQAEDEDLYAFNIKRPYGKSGILQGSDLRGLVEWLKEKGALGRFLVEYDEKQQVYRTTERI